MIYPLKELSLLSHIRGLSGSIYGLKMHSDKHIKKFAKNFGIPKYKHYPTPHLRTLADGRPYSRSFNFYPRYDFGDSHMVRIVRLKNILDKFYVFGSRLQDIVRTRTSILNRTQNYRYIRKIVGLPCNGQRSKTNAQTTKKKCRSLLKQYPQRNRLYIKILKNDFSSSV